MEANRTAIRHWEDVVFENRNKTYGAYLLRKTYSTRLLSGMAVTVMITAIILSLQKIYGNERVREAITPPVIEGVFDFIPLPPIEKKVAPARKIMEQPAAQSVPNRSIVVTTDSVVEEAEKIPLADFISEKGLGSEVVGILEGAGVFSLPEPEVFIEPVRDIAEVMPLYEGGAEAMMKFIRKEIRYPRAPRQLGIGGTVYVRFVVNGDGSVSDVEIIRGVHPDCDAEARRVVSMLPSWKGGSHNGRPVSVRMVLPIRFNLSR